VAANDLPIEEMKSIRGQSVFLVLLIGVLVCAGLPAAGFAGYNVLYFVREQLASTPTATPALPPDTPTASPTATPAPVCGGPELMFILLVGSDSRADSYLAGLADSVRVVRVDFVQTNLSYLAFPRDLYVEIPGISSSGGITHGKLNQAYLYGNPGLDYYEGPGQGPGLLALTMEENFGTRVDHYVAINLQSFVRIIDQLGGLDIYLPYTVDGRAARSKDMDRYFEAGQLHLNGYRTMLLARMRPNGDLERAKTQNLILQALAAKLLAPATLPKLAAVAEALYRSVQTDLAPGDIATLLCLGSKLDAEAIRPLSFPDELFTGTRIQDPVLGRTFIWEADFGTLREYVRQFNAGDWPSSPIGTPLAPFPTP
jgi:LCP family protein required for cell wall assembly